ncbi:hypothetical protein halTADL_0488 [Halohasta litchfieldiae]|uniref:Uncharacterized protein n=1 Tax=Halohasta litchfieldiae TaxID=1073996 RepID=A0A1H6X414_9EURY|nr:hypothetical protein halTADL_0488 [Halohasta litchfieldiae]SEJ23788.1 hypothetical protein SAMN05444271_1343 [Halohasta litchfieldiae]
MRDNSTNNEQAPTNGQSKTSLSRRRFVATSAVTASALIGGLAGTAGATKETGRFNDSPGRGGESIVPETDYREQAFHITGRTGDTATEIDGAVFNCNEGNGESIFFVGWYFEYVDEDQQRLLFTRSNNIDTERTYNWSTNGAKECGDSGVVLSVGGERVDFVQTAYKATGPQ